MVSGRLHSHEQRQLGTWPFAHPRLPITATGRILSAFALVLGVIPVLAGEALAAETIITEVRVQSSSDDAEERPTGRVSLTSSDLELIHDPSPGDQVVGIRFAGVDVPPGALVADAYIQFQVDETSSEATALTIEAEAADNAATFSGIDFDVTSRSTTVASVSWTPPSWDTVGAAGVDQRTPSLAGLVQEVVDRPGWASGAAMAFRFSGSGRRVAEAFDGVATAAPLLHIEYALSVSVTETDSLADESGDLGRIAFFRGRTDNAELTVSYDVTGSATPGSDYGALPGSVVIPAGSSTAYVDITPVDDGELEGSETVVVTVLPGADYVPGNSPTATITILDDETPAVEVSALDDLAIEGADPQDLATFLLTRSGTTDQALTVSYVLGGDTEAGVDYVAPVSTVIPAGSTSAPVVITPIDDVYSETPEIVVLDVVDGNGYSAGASNSAGVTILDNDPVGAIPVSANADDAEEDNTGNISLSSSELDLGEHPTQGPNIVGLRFGIPVPAGSTVTSAWIQFQADEVTIDPSNLVISAEAADDASPFSNVGFDISTRPRTASSLIWAPPPWPAGRVAGPEQRTPDLSALIQEVVDRPGWTSESGVVLIIEGTGRRAAAPFNADPAAAPVLHLEYSGSGNPENDPPSVIAGAISSIFPNAAILEGSVSDDLLPNGPGTISTTWSLVAGPGEVTFADATSTATTATFSAPGVYELQLTADDGELMSSDSILVAAIDPVAPAPETVRFAAIGDYGTGNSSEAAVAGMLAAANLDFIITAGDNRYVNSMDWAVGQFYSNYVGNYGGQYGLGSPVNRFFPALGNHDYSEYGGSAVYHDFFSLPGGGMVTSGTSGNERYYDFVQGPVHFFVLNSNSEEPDGRSASSTQAQWLQEQLGVSTTPWQVVYFHHPPFSSGIHGPDPVMQWPFEAWGADLVLSGHDHDYERIVKGSLPYVVTGAGGALVRGLGASMEPDSQFFYSADHGALIVEACSQRVSLEFRSVSEGVVDSYALGASTCSNSNSPPIAEEDTATTSEDSPINSDVLANDSDLDGNLDPGSVTVTADPANGTTQVEADSTITYAPDPDYSGSDGYVYQVCDTQGLCDTALVTITVTPVNDPPTADPAGPYNGVVDEAVFFDGSGSTDPDGAVVSYDWDFGDGNTGSSVNPNHTYTGPGVFAVTLTVTDDGGTTSTTAATTATITTTPNEPPVAVDDLVSTAEDTPVNIDVLANDTDPDGNIDPGSATVTADPANGTTQVEADSTITYAPDPDYSGSDGYVYQVCDPQGLCDTALVTITVTPVNDAPVAVDDGATTIEDTPVNIDLLANDTDMEGDPLTVTLLTPPSNGSAQVEADSTVRYTPGPGFKGIDSFTYTTHDGQASSNSATVTITVEAGTTVVDQVAISETTLQGSIGGSYADTFISDGVHEQLTETHSGGRPRDRTSVLEHSWSFLIQRGDSVDLIAEAFRPGNGDSDDFRFDYSTDGGTTFLPLFTVSSAAQTQYSVALPFDTSGEVIVRVIDTDRTGGNSNNDSLFVDSLLIRTLNPQPPRPEVVVTATDSSAAESGDPGMFTLHRNDSSGPLTVAYSIGGTATAGVDYVAPKGSVSFGDGQSDVTVAIAPLDDSSVEGDESVELTVIPGVDHTAGSPSTATITIADDDVIGSEARAAAETTIYGSVFSGSLASTHFPDGQVEVIAEELYAGNKRSRLEHQWTFDVLPANRVTFYLLADRVGDETFTFSYSTDGSSWIDLPVTANGTEQVHTLPVAVQGTVLVKVVDNDRSRDENSVDGVSIDVMYFLSAP